MLKLQRMSYLKKLSNTFYQKTALAALFFMVAITLLYVIFSDIQSKNILLGFLIFSSLLIIALWNFINRHLKNNSEIKQLKDKIENLDFEIEKYKDATDQKSMYLANMSHEIRTPLNTVMGMISMLNQSHLDEDQKVQVDIAKYSSRHLLQLVNMILDNSKITEESLKINIVTINLKNDFNRLFKIFEYQAVEKRLEFEYKFLPKESQKFSVLGDLAKIQQVLINLLNNSIKFTNEGKISITIDKSIDVDGYQIVTFYIKDTGIGMLGYELKNIIETSKNGDLLKSRNYQGLGIGLLISQELVKLMGGELKIESKQNEGTTFYFSLQLKKTLSVDSKKEIIEPLLINKFNVLIAEDNRMHQKVIKFLLEQLGADCTFAKNGYEAVELYKLLDFDMVFMDIYMPNIDGYEATTKIKNSAKYVERNIPIIGVSASAFSKDISNAKLAGIDDFLSKPLELTKLRELILKHTLIS